MKVVFSRCSLCGLLLFWAVSAKAEATGELTGYAYYLDSGRLAYVEKHSFLSDQLHEVKYFEPEGVLFAEKRLNYKSGSSTPELVQNNYRLGEIISLVSNSEEELSATYRADAEAKQKSRILSADDIAVVDAGFNNFIKHHWTRLVSGERIKFDYYLPTRLSTVGLAVRKTGCDERRICFEITAANRLLGLLIEPIRLKYDPETQKLMEFSGRSNIANEDGAYDKVRIRYDQPHQRLVSSDAGQ